MDTTELAAKAQSIVEDARSAAAQACDRYGLSRHNTSLATLSGALDGHIRKLRFAKDGDGTAPADLRAANHAAFLADQMRPYLGNLTATVLPEGDRWAQGREEKREEAARWLPQMIVKAEAALAEYRAAL